MSIFKEAFPASAPEHEITGISQIVAGGGIENKVEETKKIAVELPSGEIVRIPSDEYLEFVDRYRNSQDRAN